MLSARPRVDSGGGFFGRGQRAPSPAASGSSGIAVSSPSRVGAEPRKNFEYGAFWDLKLEDCKGLKVRYILTVVPVRGEQSGQKRHPRKNGPRWKF